jgi:hypothetical protein
MDAQRKWPAAAPAVTLVLASPVIVNLLFGSIRVTNPFGLLPSALGWGLGALIIREVARGRGLPWRSIMLLGLALALTEECIVLQTSLAPLIGVDPANVYGRWLGVNWPFLLWALGHETVLAVGVPILLVELFYHEHRNERWLGNAGLVVCIIVFVLGSFLTWYGWTQVFMPQAFPQSAGQVPPSSIAIAVIPTVAIAVLALNSSRVSRDEFSSSGSVPRPWQLGITAFVVGIAWSALVYAAYGALSGTHASIPLAIGVGLAATVAMVVSRWTARASWTDLHSLTLASGGLVAAMLAGFPLLSFSGGGMIDQAGKLLLNVATIIALILLGARVMRSAGSLHTSRSPAR